MSDSFYVELVSNSHELNTVANFKNKIQLLQPLVGKWEVGLVEISYSKTWKNLSRDYKLSILKRNEKKYAVLHPNYPFEYYPIKERKGVLRGGYYNDINTFINELNIEMGNIEKLDTQPKFYYDYISKYVFLSPGTDTKGGSYIPFLTDEVMEILGYEER